MILELFHFVLLSFIVSASGQGFYGRHHGRYRHDRIPVWCPARSPSISCDQNPCRGDNSVGCPNYPNAVCVNDNPCEPECIGHYYIGRQRRLTAEECGAPGADDTEVQCPPSRLRCLMNPCAVETCPMYPNAVCINDNSCEPYCIGHFYDGNTQLSRRQCRRDRPRMYGRRRHHMTG